MMYNLSDRPHWTIPLSPVYTKAREIASPHGLGFRLVLEDVGARLPPQARNVHSLLSLVEALRKEDLILIAVRHPDPGLAVACSVF